MPTFDLVYFELTRITKSVEANDMESAMRVDLARCDPFFWDNCKEETLGTMGIEAVYDQAGNLLYDAEIRDPDTGDPTWSAEVLP